MPNTNTEELLGTLRDRVDYSVRRIRNTQVTAHEILIILDGGEWLDTSTMDAIGASLQAAAENAGNAPHWAVFSAWMGPLVEEKVSESDYAGSVERHMRLAVPDSSFETLAARTLWMFPLCSFRKPYHWVLAWINWSTFEIGIFDSIPEMGSTKWAEPLLLKIVDLILVKMGRPLEVWNSGRWKLVRESPGYLDCQIDGWSCGLFVAMKVRTIAQELPPQWIINKRLGELRYDIVKMLLELPLDPNARQPSERTPALRTKRAQDRSEDSSEPEFVEHKLQDGSVVLSEASTSEAAGVGHNPTRHDSGDVDGPRSGAKAMIPTPTGASEPRISSEVSMDGLVATGRAVSVETKGEGVGRAESRNETVVTAVGSKRPLAVKDFDSDDGYRTENERKLRKQSTHKKRRGPRLNPSQRRKALQDDEWVQAGSVLERSVKCKGCHRVIALSNREDREYEINNWQKHKNTCSGITGKKLPIKNGLAMYFKPSGSDKHEEDKRKGGSKSAITYNTKLVNTTPSITSFMASNAAPPSPVSMAKPEIKPCIHLRGSKYENYINTSETRDFGGISIQFVACLSRELFPYKDFPELKGKTKLPPDASSPLPSMKVDPCDINSHSSIAKWTESERRQLEMKMKQWARWEVNYDLGFIKATACEGKTACHDRVCVECRLLEKDPALCRSIRRKNHEASISPHEQQVIIERRNKYRTGLTRNVQDASFQSKLSDPILFDVHDSLKTGKPEDCFLRLFKHAKAGNLASYDRFLEVCEVLDNKVTRESSGNDKLKYGVRYKESYINFMIAMRGYGQNSNRQYEIFSAEFAGPTARHLRSLVAKSTDALQNPALIYENVARIKRYLDSVSYKGPILVGSDCTKVKQRLNYSTELGGHVLGSTLDIADVEVVEVTDIDAIVDTVVAGKAYASQARAILVKIPLPRCPPIVVAILPTNGKETADDIHAQHLRLQQMAEQLAIPLVAFTADGASTELAAQLLMDQEKSQEPPLEYDYPLYGYHLRVPVFSTTGPVVSITDPPHAKKTSRNQPQYGTHTASLGSGHLVNRDLVDLYEKFDSGLVVKDVHNVDKQDDGAARRVFHSLALGSMISKKDEKETIHPGYEGLFSYLFVLGSLFEAWMNPSIDVRDRVLIAIRARFWLHYCHRHVSTLTAQYPDLYSSSRSFISHASFNILNRLCDTLVLLVLAYARYYPDQPFCIWHFNTGFVEHFFGIGRQLLPNFSYAELLKLVKHIMVRHRILESGLLRFKRERDSAVGYIYNAENDSQKAVEGPIPPARMTTSQLNDLVELGHDEAVRICKDILHIPIPKLSNSKPVTLAPLGAHRRKTSKNQDGRPDDSDDDYASDVSSDEGDDDDITILDDDEPDTIGAATAQASAATARYSALCDDLAMDTAEHAEALQSADICTPLPHELPPLASSSTTATAPTGSQLVDSGTSKISISRMIQDRKAIQSGTSVKSERVVTLSAKFKQVGAELESNEDIKLSSKEISHRLRIAQELNAEVKRQESKKIRQHRWEAVAKQIDAIIKSTSPSNTVLPNLSGKNVTAINPLVVGSFLIMRNNRRFYIGEVLDLYKKGDNSRYGSIKEASAIEGLAWLSLRVYLPSETVSSVDRSESDGFEDSSDSDDESTASVPEFSGTVKQHKFHLHTHAPRDHTLYHLGTRALEPIDGNPLRRRLINRAIPHWQALTRPRLKIVLAKLPALKIRIPGATSLNKI